MQTAEKARARGGSFFIRDGKFYAGLAALALPVAAQNIITYAVQLADNVMVGSLGETALSGVYLASQISTFLHMFTMGTAAAMTVLASQYWGKGDTKSVKTIVGIALRACTFVSLLLWAAVFFFPAQILSLFGGEPAVIEMGVRYIRVLSFSYVFFCMTNVLIASMRCVKVARAGLYTSLVAFVTNVFLNWVLIFGKLGFPALGVVGAALATLISRIAEFCVILTFVLKVDDRLKIRIPELFARDRDLARDFLRYGTPVILGDVFWGVNLMVQGGIVGRLGEASISAISIANTVYQVISVGIFGMREASAVTVGAAVGALGDESDTEGYDNLHRLVRTLQVIFLGMGILTSAVLFVLRDFILMLYPNLDAETLAAAKSVLTVMCVWVVGTAYQMSTLTGIVRAGGSTKFVLINDLIFVWCVVIPSSAIAAFVFKAPVWVVYACLKCDQILKCIVAVVKVNRWNWMVKLTATKAKA
ncbi:MAG TPA: MATE family efflux transporter [Clostridiales bacterium]|nr:MATE family efflux transporter [Clostridiales bacterium]